jgi:hypothetical protein
MNHFSVLLNEPCTCISLSSCGEQRLVSSGEMLKVTYDDVVSLA